MQVESHVMRQGDELLIGIALDSVVFDVVTTGTLLVEALRILEEHHHGLVCCQLGSFGSYSVTLNLHHDDSVSIFVDGPEFTSARNQSVGIWIQKDEVHRILAAALQDSVANG